MNTASKSFAQLLQSFFCQRLQIQQRLSGHTLASYRDTFRLGLQFMKRQTGRDPSRQQLEDWDAANVLAFLDYVEQERHCRARTRNARLAAIRAFMRYAAQQEPAVLNLCNRVLAIPMKRFNRPLLGFLSRPELDAILGAPDAHTAGGRRDRMLFELLYHTGARVSEMLALQRKDIHLGPVTSLQLNGKGRKERALPLQRTVAKNLERHLAELPGDPNTPVFTNRFGQPLSRSGVERRLRLTVKLASRQNPSLKGRKISPHTFRHSTAMHLLQAGVNITVIALMLGHESPATTHHYVELDLKMKEESLRKLQPTKTRTSRFKPNDQLLVFLENL